MVREGYVLIHPNRRSASAKATRFIVALLLVISAALLAIVTIGGWDKLQSAKVLQIAWVVLYLLFAFLVSAPLAPFLWFAIGFVPDDEHWGKE